MQCVLSVEKGWVLTSFSGAVLVPSEAQWGWAEVLGMDPPAFRHLSLPCLCTFSCQLLHTQAYPRQLVWDFGEETMHFDQRYHSYTHLESTSEKSSVGPEHLTSC